MSAVFTSLQSGLYKSVGNISGWSGSNNFYLSVQECDVSGNVLIGALTFQINTNPPSNLSINPETLFLQSSHYYCFTILCATGVSTTLGQANYRLTNLTY